MNDAVLSFDDFCDLDISSRKHGGSLESKDAFTLVRGSINGMHEEVLAAIDKFGPLTSKELAQILGRPVHSVSGRCSELKALCYLEKVPGLRREGSAVLRRAEGMES